MTSEKQEGPAGFPVEDATLKSRREVLLMGALAATGVMSIASASAATSTKEVAAAAPATAKAGGPIAAKDFSKLVSSPMEGFSAKMIGDHLKLYSGYVDKINQIQASLNTVDIVNPAPNATYHPLRELLMEESFALNGVIYHELYFGNLGGAGGDPTGDLKTAIESRWGSTAKFLDFFKASGKCMRGWVVVGWNTRDGQLHTYGLDMHNMWVPANVVPVIVLDVYEHAYMTDYGINRAQYLDAFLKNVDWNVCNARYNSARQHPFGPAATV